MSKRPNLDYAETVSSYNENDDNSAPAIGHVSIAKVTYDHYPIRPSKHGRSFGEMIEGMVRRTLESGDLVSSVQLHFETPEMQMQLREMLMSNRI